jgi:hypothetical protein
VAEPVVRVDLTASFLERLAAIESSLTDTVSTPGHMVHLLSIRHHRELSTQFSRMWAGQAGSPER